jgi:hypothetical protein
MGQQPSSSKPKARARKSTFAKQKNLPQEKANGELVLFVLGAHRQSVPSTSAESLYRAGVPVLKPKPLPAILTSKEG